MPFPTINSVNPTSTPAVPALTFNKAFLTVLQFTATSPASKWTCLINTRNYDPDSNTLGPNDINNNHIVRLTDVQSYAAQYPVFAQTLATVLETAGLVQSERAATDALAKANRLLDSDPTKADKVSSATAALAAASTALGA